MHVESSYEVAERLQNELPIIPYTREGEGAQLTVVGQTEHQNEQVRVANWRIVYNPSLIGPNARKISSQDLETFAEAAQAVRNDQHFYEDVLPVYDGAWWRYSPAEGAVNNSLREVYSVAAHEAAGTRSVMEVLNCSSIELAADELAILKDTIEQVGKFTRGKIYDRVKGIVFCGDEEFADHDLGGFHFPSGVMRLNMDKLRDAMHTGLPQRYIPYFRGKNNVSAFSITLAHELGHAMDIQTMEEVNRHFISPDQHGYMALGSRTASFSSFNELPGWTYKVVPQGRYGKRDEWRFDVGQALEGREYPPNTYAHTKPSEDMGESFAIAALGGDMSSMPMRRNRIRETIDRAEGREAASHQLEMQKIEPQDGVYRPRKLGALALDVYIA